jgi:hypothetical protein
MGVGAIQQLASPQQISRSITTRAAPPQQDNLDGFSKKYAFSFGFSINTPSYSGNPFHTR